MITVMAVRGKGYGITEVTYEVLNQATGVWTPITKVAIRRKERAGAVVMWNPGR